MAASGLITPELRSRAGWRIQPSCGCNGAAGGGCNCGGQPAQIVYAIGRIGYDYGTEARRDALLQAASPNANVFALSDAEMLTYIAKTPSDAQAIIWTLNFDAVPVYAVRPNGPFAPEAYAHLREFLSSQIHGESELVSIPGIIVGKVQLLSGQVVPVIEPELRGMFNWSIKALVKQVYGPEPDDATLKVSYAARINGLLNYINRIYYDARNLGVTPEERALNFSATNAAQVAAVISSVSEKALELDTIAAKRSLVCRLGSDCFDIELAFFDPNNTEMASRVFRFTIDVSDVTPVSLGEVRSWSRR